LNPDFFNVILLEQQKIVLKVLSMSDEKTKKKAIEAVAEIYGKIFPILFFVIVFAAHKTKDALFES
jgi:phosphoribosylcarboxyaminoimidazole (NCAIR) mutase